MHSANTAFKLYVLLVQAFQIRLMSFVLLSPCYVVWAMNAEWSEIPLEKFFGMFQLFHLLQRISRTNCKCFAYMHQVCYNTQSVSTNPLCYCYIKAAQHMYGQSITKVDPLFLSSSFFFSSFIVILHYVQSCRFSYMLIY